MRVRVVDLATGRGWCGARRPTSTSATGTRRSAPSRGGRRRPSSGSSRATPTASAAEIAEIVRWRREHQPGGQNAGSVFTNPPGDSAGGWSTRPGARASASAPPRCRPSTPTSSRPTPAGRPTTCVALIDEVRGAGARRTPASTCTPEVRARSGFATTLERRSRVERPPTDADRGAAGAPIDPRIQAPRAGRGRRPTRAAAARCAWPSASASLVAGCRWRHARRCSTSTAIARRGRRPHRSTPRCAAAAGVRRGDPLLTVDARRRGRARCERCPGSAGHGRAGRGRAPSSVTVVERGPVAAVPAAAAAGCSSTATGRQLAVVPEPALDLARLDGVARRARARAPAPAERRRRARPWPPSLPAVAGGRRSWRVWPPARRQLDGDRAARRRATTAAVRFGRADRARGQGGSPSPRCSTSADLRRRRRPSTCGCRPPRP